MIGNKRNKIAKYAAMASAELHEEYMNLNYSDIWYVKDIMSEVIDKLDKLEAMARIRWYNKWYYTMKWKRYLNG